MLQYSREQVNILICDCIVELIDYIITSLFHYHVTL